MYEFQILPSKDGQWYWAFVCTQNGKIMGCSETMHNRADVESAVATMQREAVAAPVRIIEKES